MNLLFILGISLSLAQYVPEQYGWACYRMAAKRSWPQCANLSSTKQKECLCGIPDFLSLTEVCLTDAVANATDPVFAAQYARNMSLCRVKKPVTTFKGKILNDYKIKSLISPENLLEYQYINPIDPAEVKMAVATGEWRMTNDRRSSQAGSSLIGFWAAIIVLKALIYYLPELVPTSIYQRAITCKPMRFIRSKIVHPSLVGIKFRIPWLIKNGVQPPTRGFTIALVLFAALNFSLIFTNFPYEPDNFIYTTYTQQWNKSLAIRSAFMIMWKLPLVFCFAGRNNIFLLVGHPWSMDTFNVLHRWIARITIVDIIIHGVAISCVKIEQGIYGYVWSVDYWRWGVVGVILAGVITIQSLKWFTNRFYEIFKLLHVVLAIIFVIASWYHVTVLPYGTKHMYAVFAIWAFDHLARWIRIMLALRANATIEHVHGSMSIIRITSPSIYTWAIRRQSQYLFLHVPPGYLFWQSHPFTIVRDWKKLDSDSKLESVEFDASKTVTRGSSAYGIQEEEESVGDKSKFHEMVRDQSKDSSLQRKEFSADNFVKDCLVVAIQHRSGITKRLGKLPEGSLKVLLDGPYGAYIPFSRFRKIVFIAGGIGITAHISYIQQLITVYHQTPPRLKLYWAVHDLSTMAWLMDAIALLSSHMDIEIFTSSSDSVAHSGLWRNYPIKFNNTRLKCSKAIYDEVQESALCEYICPTAIVSCGPPCLNEDARIAACDAIYKATIYVDYFEESFSW